MRDATCSIEGCEKRPGARGVCSMHRARMDRTGTYDPRPPKVYRSSVNAKGYMRISVSKDHPLAKINSLIGKFSTTSLWEHRVVLFDKIGYGPHSCAHCDRHLNWGAGLLVDHVDTDKQNNAPDNLVPSCNGCNIRLGFIRRKTAA